MERVSRRQVREAVQDDAASAPPVTYSSGPTVTVACKLPHGLMLQLYNQVDQQEQTMTGSRTVGRAVKDGEPIRIFGNAVPYGKTPPYKIVGGYALTENVPADFWNKWLSQGPDRDVVKNRLIFAWETTQDAEAEAKDLKDTKSGLEPLNADPRKEPRAAKPVTKNVSPLERGDTTAG